MLANKPFLTMVQCFALTIVPLTSIAADNPPCELEHTDSIPSAIDQNSAGALQVRQAISEAVCLNEAAARLDAEWLNTAELIDMARQEAEQENWAAAVLSGSSCGGAMLPTAPWRLRP